MSRQGGLTLVELIVTVAVAIVLLAVGIPLFQGITASSRSVAQANALVEAITLARSEAVKRGAAIALCPKASGTETNPPAMVCGTALQWTNGWILFTDAEGSNAGVYEPGNNESVLRFWGAAPTNEVIATTATSLRYLSTGERPNGAAVVTLDAYKGGCTGNRGRRVTVSLAGQPMSSELACP